MPLSDLKVTKVTKRPKLMWAFLLGGSCSETPNLDNVSILWWKSSSLRAMLQAFIQGYYLLQSFENLNWKVSRMPFKSCRKEIWPPWNTGVYGSKCSAGEGCEFLTWQLQGLKKKINGLCHDALTLQFCSEPRVFQVLSSFHELMSEPLLVGHSVACSIWKWYL